YGLACLEKEGRELTHVGQQPQNESHQQDHEIMMPQAFLLGRGLRASNICGAQRTSRMSVAPTIHRLCTHRAWRDRSPGEISLASRSRKMTLDQYNEVVKQIFAEQQTIATETIQQALAGAANPMNPQFIALMNRQWELIQRMMKLNGEMLLGIGKS